MSLYPVSPTLSETHPLAVLHASAFAHDPLLKLMYGALDEDLDAFAHDLVALVRDDPTARLTKAIHVPSGRVAGWSWWNVYPDNEAYAAAARDDDAKAQEPPSTAISAEAYTEHRELIAQRRERWIAGGDGVAILQILVVDPSFQGQGIGAQLFLDGVEEAKKLGVPVWIESTEEGYQFYLKHGICDVREDIVMDLTKYGLDGVISRAHCMLLDVDAMSGSSATSEQSGNSSE